MVGVGIVGWGTAGRLMAEAVERSDRFALAAVADADPEVPAAHRDVDALAADPAVDIVYIATPTPHHRDAVVAAAGAGPAAIIVEKPIAASVADATACIEAAERAGVPLIVGATRSFDAPVQWVRDVVTDGGLGSLLAVTSACATDWLTRPRRPADLDAYQGGGLVYRQGGHQLDVVRYVAGGRAETIVGTTYGGADGTERGYHALVRFADGVSASVAYGGAGGFDTRLLTFGVGEVGERIEAHTAFGSWTASPPGTHAPLSALTVATFEGGDVLPTPTGLLVFSPTGTTERRMPPRASGWDAVLTETAAVLDGAAPTHSGRWGLATLECCAALHASARTGQPVRLRHQIEITPQEVTH